MRICFRFPKTKDNHREWLDFGSPRICPHKSKVIKKERKDPKENASFIASDPMDEASFYFGGKSMRPFDSITSFNAFLTDMILHP